MIRVINCLEKWNKMLINIILGVLLLNKNINNTTRKVFFDYFLKFVLIFFF